MSDSAGAALARIAELFARAQQRQRDTATLAASIDQSTPLSWLWALIFGPAYFAVHGFRGRALLVLALGFVVVGLLLAPFLAYQAWRERAMIEARRLARHDPPTYLR